MKKLLLAVILVLCFVSISWACVGEKCDFDNEVKSSGEGNKGYIFTYDCTKNNNIDVGTWVDPSTIPSLKGDTGASGKDGLTPVKGVDYFDGSTGASGTDGKTPIKGVDYTDGSDGKDVDPTTVNNLQNNINSNSSSINNLNNRLDKLEETQTIVGAEVRILDTKKWTVTLFADYSENRQMIDRTGIKFTYKIGSSYLDKEVEKINKRLNDLEEK